MWLTNSALLLFRRHIPGRIFIGKHRVKLKVTRHQRKRAMENEMRIEKNTEILSYPYLSVEEEHSHAVDRKHENKRLFFELVKKRRDLGQPVFNSTISNSKGYLEHLNVTKT